MFYFSQIFLSITLNPTRHINPSRIKNSNGLTDVLGIQASGYKKFVAVQGSQINLVPIKRVTTATGKLSWWGI